MIRHRTLDILAALAIAGCFMPFPGAASAASESITMRIGFIDTDKVIKTSSPVKGRLDEAERKMRPMEEELNDLYKRMAELETKLKSLTVLSPEGRAQLEDQRSKLTGQISEKSAKMNSELNKAYAEMSESMTVAIQNAIEQVARQRQFTVILNADTVAYMDKALVSACDITPDVIARLNANANAAKAVSGSTPAPSILKEPPAPKPEATPKAESTGKPAVKPEK